MRSNDSTIASTRWRNSTPDRYRCSSSSFSPLLTAALRVCPSCSRWLRTIAASGAAQVKSVTSTPSITVKRLQPLGRLAVTRMATSARSARWSSFSLAIQGSLQFLAFLHSQRMAPPLAPRVSNTI